VRVSIDASLRDSRSRRYAYRQAMVPWVSLEHAAVICPLCDATWVIGDASQPHSGTGKSQALAIRHIVRCFLIITDFSLLPTLRLLPSVCAIR